MIDINFIDSGSSGDIKISEFIKAAEGITGRDTGKSICSGIDPIIRYAVIDHINSFNGENTV